MRPPTSSAGHAAVLIDRQALADQGIWPASPVVLEPASADSDEVTQGLSVLQHVDLALIVSPEALLITTAPAVADERARNSRRWV